MSEALAPQNGADGLLETRRRAERIDHYLDLIPARFYLGTAEAAQAKGDSRNSLDPARAKSTSQLIVEAAAAEGRANGASGNSGSSREKRKKKAKAETPSAPNSRTELREKLERRILELREERKRRQSAQDKARAAEARAAKEAGATAPNGSATARKANASQGKSQNSDGDEDDDDEGPEAGRMNFDVSASDLPYEASVGKRGKKVRKLRADLRRAEVEASKLKEAEARGEGEELRKEIAMRKALQRARGEKVHDDASKLRKVQKRMETNKKKGKEKWAAKVASDKQQAEDKQATRKQNLKDRSNKKKAKRLGFEGKRNDYLNSDA